MQITLQQAKNKDNKYRATFVNPKTGKQNNVEFGSAYYSQFKDSTPLMLFSNKNHNDPERRKRYYQRHGQNKGEFLSKDWFSKRFLW